MTASSHLSNVWFSVTPLQVSHGQGCWVTTTTGEEYLDFAAGIAVNSTGHAHPAVAAAIGAQAQRSYRNAPRTLDLDILLYGDTQISSPNLEVPHPRMWERAFVLRPLAELVPAMVTPAQLHAVADQAVWLHAQR